MHLTPSMIIEVFFTDSCLALDLNIYLSSMAICLFANRCCLIVKLLTLFILRFMEVQVESVHSQFR